MLFCQKNISVDGKILYTIVRLYEISCTVTLSAIFDSIYIYWRKRRGKSLSGDTILEKRNYDSCFLMSELNKQNDILRFPDIFMPKK